MKFCQLDHDPYTGDAPIAAALRWLQTLLNAPNVPWSPMQHEAASAVLLRATARMHAEVYVTTQEGVVVPKLLDASPDAIVH